MVMIIAGEENTVGYRPRPQILTIHTYVQTHPTLVQIIAKFYECQGITT